MKIILMLLTLLILSTIAYGVKMQKQKEGSKRQFKLAAGINLAVFIPLMLISMIPNAVFAATSTTAASNSNAGLGYLAAALSTGLAAIGAGIGVGHAGSAAVGAISEDASILGKTLIILGLAEGVAIYGLVISIMILSKL